MKTKKIRNLIDGDIFCFIEDNKMKIIICDEVILSKKFVTILDEEMEEHTFFDLKMKVIILEHYSKVLKYGEICNVIKII